MNEWTNEWMNEWMNEWNLNSSSVKKYCGFTGEFEHNIFTKIIEY